LALGGLYPLSFERGLSARALFIVAIIAVLLPALLVTGWLAHASAEAEQAQIEKNIQQRTHEISAILDREISGVKGMLTALATSSSLHNGNLQGFHAKAREISQQLDLQIILYDVVRNRYVLTTVVPFGTPLDGISFPKELVDKVVSMNGPYVTGVALSPIAHRYGVGVIVPVRHAEQTQYLLGAAIRTTKIVNVFDLVRLQPPFIAAVVDRNRLIVARSQKHDEFVGKPVLTRRINPGPGEHGQLGPLPNLEGVEFRWFYEKSAITEWTVLVGAPDEVLRTSFRRVSQLLAGSALALFAIGIGIAYRIGGRFSRAVSELGTVARELPHQAPPPKVSSNLREANRLLDDLKAASADLRATDAQQRFAIEAAGIGTWSWDLLQGRLMWSRRTREFYRLSPDELPTVDHILNSIHPADRDIMRENMERCFDSTDNYEIEFRVLNPDGKTYRWVSGKGRVERDRTGAAVFMHGAMQDVTERKESERERGELRRRLMSAQEEERLRLAHELHDQTGQSLTAALLEVKQIGAVVSDEGNVHLARLREQLEDIGKTVHRIARELRPTALEDLGLRAALANHLSEWSVKYGIPSDFHFRCACEEDEKGLPGDVTTAIYRIAQEALTNVAKHAEGVTAVSLIINCNTELVQMTIEDNGCGFDTTSRPGGDSYSRLGLAGMRERAGLVGGSIEIESSPAAGTTIFVRVPLEKRRHVA
jgi:two-component system, NarL family, sensor histidine kinase UhpB